MMTQQDLGDIGWNPSLSTDITSLDEQHQKLLLLAQILLNILSSPTATLVEKQNAFQNFTDFAIQHFMYEERVLQNIAYPHLDAHLADHKGLRAEIEKILETVNSAQHIGDWKGLVSMIEVWVIHHIVEFDVPIKKYIQRQ